MTDPTPVPPTTAPQLPTPTYLQAKIALRALRTIEDTVLTPLAGDLVIRYLQSDQRPLATTGWAQPYMTTGTWTGITE